MRVIVFEEHDMEVDAVIEFEKEDYGWSHRWFAEPDWSTIRDWDEATQQYLSRTG